MAPAEGRRRIRPAGQRTPEHCLYGRIHPAYERPRTCRRQPGQLGQLARGDNTMHNAALRYTSASGLDLSADYTHYSSWQLAAMRNRYADGSRTAFDVVSGQSVDRVNVSADQSHDLGNGWGMTYGASSAGRATTTTSDTRSARATSPPSIPIRTSTNTRATSTPG